MLDTGTQGWSFPEKVDGVPLCGSTGVLAELYCPDAPMGLKAFILNSSASPQVSSEVDFQIANLLSTQQAVNVTSELGIALPSSSTGNEIFLAGIPFFFGRTVYYGLYGAQTPVGIGPFDAF